MTFEEFFFKKKIDLAQFKNTDPNLLLQFKDHFTHMGEKSFDHTKKYWFNNLRRQFPLSETEEARLKELYTKPIEKPPVESSTVTENVVISAEKPSGFKPKFKAAALASKVQENEAKPVEEPITKHVKPVGFKPKFKSAQTPDITEEKVSKEVESDKAVKPAGFKPRFKAGSTAMAKPTASAIDENDNPESLPPKSITQEVKPLGFKPRFKAGTTSVKKADDNVSPSPDDVKENVTEETKDKPAYKPRFKMNQVKKSED